jgi:hypothetical protein
MQKLLLVVMSIKPYLERTNSFSACNFQEVGLSYCLELSCPCFVELSLSLSLSLSSVCLLYRVGTLEELSKKDLFSKFPLHKPTNQTRVVSKPGSKLVMFVAERVLTLEM